MKKRQFFNLVDIFNRDYQTIYRHATDISLDIGPKREKKNWPYHIVLVPYLVLPANI